MGNGFELRIGMTTQQVMSNISRMNATDKTKQMIINFCNNDQDKKISNEIELAMLNSWANGSEKVPMPKTLKMYDAIEDFKDVKEVSVDKEPGNRDILIDYDNDGNADARKIYTTKIGQNAGPRLWMFKDTKLSGIFDEFNFWNLNEK